MALDDPTITDPFFRALYNRIAPEIDRRMVQLAAGSARQIVGSPETVGESYARQVAYIEGMNEVLKVGRDIQTEMQGGTPGAQREETR